MGSIRVSCHFHKDKALYVLFRKRTKIYCILKSLSPLFFSVFDEKLSHLWLQIQKKQLNFLHLSMGFDRKKIKI